MDIRKLFGPRETQNERLLREAGLARDRPFTEPEPEPEEPPEEPAHPRPPLDPLADVKKGFDLARGLSQQPREWHALVAAEAPELQGAEIVFYVLTDGSIIVDTQEGDDPLDPLVDVLADLVQAPYRARAVHQEDAVWLVGANAIDVVELPGVTADEFTLGVYAGEVVVGDQPVGDARPYAPLEELAAQRGYTDYAAQATRLEDDAFELVLTPL